jgi:hypothetical protein
MQSVLHRGPVPLLILVCAMWALTGCVSAGPIVANPRACSDLVPQAWRTPVPGAPLPDGEEVADWIVFGEKQTGQLEIANDRGAAVIHIVSTCEAQDAAALNRTRRPWWRIW